MPPTAWTLALLLILAAGSSTLRAAAAMTAPSDLSLTVLTYNIHHGAGMDKKIDLDRIARVIRSSEADLVALQEIQVGGPRVNGLHEAAELARLTGMHPVFGETMPFDGGKYGDSILSKFPIISHRIIPLPFTPGNHREPRIAMEIICQTPIGKVAFLSTHLDHTGHSPDRLPQAKKIVEVMATEHRPAILAGDFNCQPDSPPIKAIEQAWTIASAGDPSPTCPSDHPKEKIDHVFIKPAACFRIVSSKVIDEEMASDHRPVVVRLELQSHSPAD